MDIVSILAAIFIFGIMIFIHEFGHFIIARKNGIRVIEFAIGMGPTIFSFGKKDTKYSLKLFPFGGYCRMQGFEDEQLDDEDKKELDATQSFESKSVWARISVVAAGPIFNFVLAFVLAIIVIGYVGYDPAEVIYVDENSPAAEAGLQVGDVITYYDGENINFGRDLDMHDYFEPIKNDMAIVIKYKRDGKETQTSLYPVLKKKYAVGFMYTIDDGVADIEQVVEGGALHGAGVKDGDVIVSVNGTAIASSRDLNKYFDENPITESDVHMVLERNGEQFEVTVTPSFSYEYYDTGFLYNYGRQKTDALGTIKYSFAEVGLQIKTVYRSLGMLFTGGVSVNDFSGPVGIADIINDTYEASKPDGFIYVFLNFANLTIMLSANLGVMNLLPIPGLDGGRLLFLIIELVRRKPVDKKKEGMIHVIGMLLIMAFAMFILFKDVFALFK